jgi:hypothetical protein
VTACVLSAPACGRGVKLGLAASYLRGISSVVGCAFLGCREAVPIQPTCPEA